MDIYEAIYTRRTVRTFKEIVIKDEIDLDILLPEDAPDERRDRREGEVPVHDSRNAREHFEDGLQDVADLRTGVLGEVDGHDHAEGQGHQHGVEACRERGGDEGQDAEFPDRSGMLRRSSINARRRAALSIT